MQFVKLKLSPGIFFDDFSSFLTCVDDDGRIWRLRGHGITPREAAEDVWNLFSSGCVETWKKHGGSTKYA